MSDALTASGTTAAPARAPSGTREGSESVTAQLRQLEEIFLSLSELSHKINNPLTAVMGRAQLLRGYPDSGPRVAKTAEIIEESAGRIAELVREVARLVKSGREEVLAELFPAEHPPGGGDPL